MTFRNILLSVLAIIGAALPWSAIAQGNAAVATEQAEAPKPATVFVMIETAQGAIVIEVEKERAPITAANFLRYVDEKRFDGAAFYRSFSIGDDFGLLQGGVRTVAKLLPPIAHEPTSETGLSHKTGTVSMARAAEGTAQSDFFIVIGDMSSLDAKPDQPGDNSGFAAFGHVVEGMDIVRALMAGEISPTLGADNGMQGQMLAAPVKIVSARRAPDWKPAPQPEPEPAVENDSFEADSGDMPDSE